MQPIPVRIRWFLVLVLLAAFALRLVRLGAESLWYDETVSVYLAGNPIPELIRHTAGDIHPPGYYLLLRSWLAAGAMGTGKAAPGGFTLEFWSAYLSLGFGVFLVALGFVLGARAHGHQAGLAAAVVIAFSPFNIWYSQEARMYTVGAALGAVAFYSLLRVSEGGSGRRWWIAYTVSSVAGMYALYYFAFLLIAVNAWYVVQSLRRSGARALAPWALSNLAVVILYAPWLPVAWRQATQPPVPPWRDAPRLFGALAETVQALALGQSAPAWSWPVAALGAILAGVGVRVIARRSSSVALGFASAAFVPVALILLLSLATPLYHVRYMFTYSPVCYALIGVAFATVAARRRALAAAMAAVWLVLSGVSLARYWTAPSFRPDDLRTAVTELQERWRPGDALLINAGYVYPALATYWQGEFPHPARITSPLPVPDEGAAPFAVSTGSLDGPESLGWGDPRSDFFAASRAATATGIAALFDRFDRVWHFRIYDTVTDPDGSARGMIENAGSLADDRVYTGEANLRVQAFLGKANARGLPEAYAHLAEGGTEVGWQPVSGEARPGGVLYVPLDWRAAGKSRPELATSLRLVDAYGETWAQGPDERPLGNALPPRNWPEDTPLTQVAALAIPGGIPPGEYAVELVIYDPATGAPYDFRAGRGSSGMPSAPLALGTVTVTKTVASARPTLAAFGPLALLEASTPATVVSPGDAVPVDLLWQAREAPGEPLVVVVQALDEQGAVRAALEAQPAGGAYPTDRWETGEIVRDRHTLVLGEAVPAGTYRLIAGVYRAAGGTRLAKEGSRADHAVIGAFEVRGGS
jgi:hypothetical protein